MKESRVLIVVRGGVVQEVYVDGKVDVKLLDYDESNKVKSVWTTRYEFAETRENFSGEL